jgi:putative endonuclease
MSTQKTWLIYIIQCNDNTYYTGITNDLEKRIKSHNLGTASKYTRVRLPVKLVYTENNLDRSSASKREYAIKQLTRIQKEALIRSK